MLISAILYSPSAMVLVPTQVKTVLGLYMEREPVETAPVADSGAILYALQKVWDRGVQTVPHPKAFPSASKTPTVKAAGAKSWTDFVRNARLWTIEEATDETYQIQRWHSPARKSHFEPNTDGALQFPKEAAVSTDRCNTI